MTLQMCKVNYAESVRPISPGERLGEHPETSLDRHDSSTTSGLIVRIKGVIIFTSIPKEAENSRKSRHREAGRSASGARRQSTASGRDRPGIHVWQSLLRPAGPRAGEVRNAAARAGGTVSHARRRQLRLLAGGLLRRSARVSPGWLAGAPATASRPASRTQAEPGRRGGPRAGGAA